MKCARRELASPEPPGPLPGAHGQPGLPQEPAPSLAALRTKIPTPAVGPEKRGKKGGDVTSETRWLYRSSTGGGAAAQRFPRRRGVAGVGGALAGPAPRVRGRGCPGQAAVGDRSPSVGRRRAARDRVAGGTEPRKRAPQERLRRGNSIRGREVAGGAAAWRWLSPPPCCG